MSENVQADRADTGPAPAAPSSSITAASSLALLYSTIPDYFDVVIVPTRGVAETDPRVWADAIFSHENTPLRKRGMLAVRDEAIRLFDMVPPPAKQYVVDEVVGGEALIRDDDEKLSVRIGVALLPGGEIGRAHV